MNERLISFGQPWHRFAFGCGCILALAFPASGQTPWTEQQSGVSSTLHDVAFGKGAFIAVGNGGVLLRSENGANWERVSSPTTDNLIGVCLGRGLFVAVGQGGRILCSPDGYAWISTRVEAASLNTVTLGNSRFIAGGSQGKIFVSDDGLTWAERATPGAIELTDLTSYAGVIVAVGFFATAWASLDGDTWSPQTISGFPSFTSVRHFKKEFLATVGSGATMHRSTNGMTWESTANGTGSRLNALTKGLESIVAVGFDQAIFTSTNGVNWSEHHRGNTSQLLGVAYGNGRFVAVGEGGAIFSAPETGMPASVVSLEVVDAIASELGGNSALVRLSRTGDLSQPATVNLLYTGTATPGTDYAALPATVVMPVDTTQTNLMVTPVLDAEVELTEIVAISIASAAGASIDPLAESVAAFLMDAVEPTTGRLSAVGGAPGRGAILQLNTVAALEVSLEATTSFQTWVPAFSLRNPFGQVVFTDPAASNFTARYYRVAP